MKKKTLYWIVGSVATLIILLLVLKASGVIGKEEGIKVAADKAANKDIIEVVAATGKIYLK